MTLLPERSEAADYYFRYIDKVSTTNILEYLDDQCRETVALLSTVSESRSLRRYATRKWTLKEVISHLNDAERVFAFRAFWFARGFVSPLPSFDQNHAAGHAVADDRTWESHVEEFRAIRTATVTLFSQLPEVAWDRRGMASGNEFSVRALAFVIAGHTAHHVEMVTDRYLK